ncbi:MAG: glycosyltransferase family 2 protein [Actinobacteria bacterium]|nr:glycosyltransferase family 2 protein [Actinomycetota bacterium]
MAALAVAWNEVEMTVACLRSVSETAPDALLFFVDSGSVRDPGPRLAELLPEARLLRLDANRGYAAALNAGAELALEAGATHLLFLNNDTVVEAGAVDTLLKEAGRHPDAILAPTIVYAALPDRVWSAGGYVVGPLLENHHLGKDRPRPDPAEPHPVAWATACALLVSAGTYRRLGPFDARYFLYLEDTDWCLRAGRQGIPTLHVPGAVVRHHVSTSVETLPSWNVRYYAYRNRYYLALRNSTPWARPLVPLDALWTLVKAGLRSVSSGAYRRDHYYHARTRGVVDFLRGRMGEAPASGARRAPAPESVAS